MAAILAACTGPAATATNSETHCVILACPTSVFCAGALPQQLDHWFCSQLPSGMALGSDCQVTKREWLSGDRQGIEVHWTWTQTWDLQPDGPDQLAVKVYLRSLKMQKLRTSVSQFQSSFSDWNLCVRSFCSNISYLWSSRGMMLN